MSRTVFIIGASVALILGGILDYTQLYQAPWWAHVLAYVSPVLLWASVTPNVRK